MAWWWDATDWHGCPYKDIETHGKDLAHKKGLMKKITYTWKKGLMKKITYIRKKD